MEIHPDSIIHAAALRSILALQSITISQDAEGGLKARTGNITHALIALDERATYKLQINSRDSLGWKFAALLAHSGDSWFWASGLSLAWLLSRGEWHRDLAVMEIAVVFQALFVFVLKQFIRRPRPTGEWGGVGGIYRQIDPHSFPSGHATRAVMLIVLTLGLGTGAFAWVLGLWAPVMSLSRVLTGVHYLSDILGGALLGLALGLIILAVYPLWIAWVPFLFYR